MANSLEVFKANSLSATMKCYYDEDEDATVDLTDATATFVVKDEIGGTEYISTSLTISDQTLSGGYMTLYLSTTHTDIDPGTYVYEINLSLSGSPEDYYTVEQNSFVVKERL